MTLVCESAKNMKTSETRQITLRLPESLYQTMKRLSKERKVSVNRLAQESMEKIAREQLEKQMRDAYEELGKDAEENDVEIFLSAECEVVLKDE